MTEADWLAAKDPEQMFELVQSRLSARRQHLLACALVRRTWDFLGETSLRQALDWCEVNPAKTVRHKKLAAWQERVQTAGQLALNLARASQHEIVRVADPDFETASRARESESEDNPALALFAAASRSAAASVEQAGLAAMHATEAIHYLISLTPGQQQLAEVRRCVVAATQARAAAGLYASSALKLKQQADQTADADPRKKLNVRHAVVQEILMKEDEALTNKIADLEDQKTLADRKAFGRFLHEIAGNPFGSFRFETAWRTDDVVNIAKSIYKERFFDRMPILADALLDADCDEEPVLRHCRGTETHAPDGVLHIRGCWVLDLILKHEPAMFKSPPITVNLAPPKPPAEEDDDLPLDMASLSRLLRSLDPANLQDQEDALLAEDDEDEVIPPPPPPPSTASRAPTRPARKRNQ